MYVNGFRIRYCGVRADLKCQLFRVLATGWGNHVTAGKEGSELGKS